MQASLYSVVDVQEIYIKKTCIHLGSRRSAEIL